MREQNKKIAEETLAILKRGSYQTESKTYQIAEQVEKSVEETKTYTEKELKVLEENISAGNNEKTKIKVTADTTLGAAQELSKKYTQVLVLNFASAKNPGGGFLKGSSAQEESIARSSSLYEALKGQKEFYDYHAKNGTALYSSRAIYSPGVVVMRGDRGELIEPYRINVVTTAAVNAGVVKERRKPNEIKQINQQMEERILNTLRIAKQEKQEALVLGAFGCGVFKNDPNIIAELFRRSLKRAEFQGVFKEIVFAIYEGRGETKIKRIFEIKMK